MVLALWDGVKFLWSHPIISCLVLLLFSPPFFPIIVYFSPVLLCTGLVAIAMVSMSMGENPQSQNWRNGVYEQGLHHRVDVPVNPARESWLEWMKKKEEKAKAWVDSRFLNQDKWQFQNTSVLAPEEEDPDLVLDNNNENDVQGYPTPSYKAPTPIITKRGPVLSPLHANRDVLPPLAKVAKGSNDRAYSSVPAAENVKPIPRAQVHEEDRLFAFSNSEDPPPATLEVPLAAIVEEEVLKGKSVVPSPLLKEEVLLPVGSKVDNVARREIPLVGIGESFSRILEKQTHERIAEVLESIASEELSGFVLGSNQVATVEELIVGNGRLSGDLGIPVSSLEAVQKVVDEEAGNFQTSALLDGRRLSAVEVPVSPEFSFFGEDQRACPEAEAEAETKSSVFSQYSQEAAMNPPTQRFIATEKIIFVDEPSTFTRVQSQSMVAETAGQWEALPILKATGQIVVVETKLHEKLDLADEDSKSPKDGLDENIESYGNSPPPSSTSSTTSATVLVEKNPDAMALVKSQSLLEEFLPESSCKALVQSTPYLPTDLELLAEQMEPMMALIHNDPGAQFTTFGGSVLDKSYSLNSTFKAEREEYDDLTVRFNALKKSMSLDTTRRWEEPIPMSLRIANKATANAIVPVYIPDFGSSVERENQFLESSLVFPEKEKPLARPGLSSEDVESLESLTARLQKKFTLNLGNNVTFSSPPSRPVPALPSTAAAPTSVETGKSVASVESNKSVASVESDKSVASVESDKRVEVMGSIVPPIDDDAVKSKLKHSHSKKSLTSFLSRRREKLMSQLVDPFSISGEGEKGGRKISSGTTADTVTSAEIVSESREEGSTTSGRHLKEKMISPLKRVFSMDANTDSSSSRKVEVGRVSSVKSSPVKEKHSVIDRSKDRLMKLFSNEGGLTNVEVAGSDTISLEQSISVSQKTEDQNVELTEDHDGVVENATSPALAPSLIPSEVVHGVENVDVKSERQEELPSIEVVGEPPAETVEEFDSIVEPVTSSPTEESMPMPTLDARGPDTSAKGRGSIIIKSSSDKKFAWSWRNSQKSVARKIGEQNVELKEDHDGVVANATSPALAPSLIPSEVVHGVENVDVKSERQEELPSIEVVGEPPAETVEEFDSIVEPVASSPTEESVPMPTLDARGPDTSAKGRGGRIAKSSSDKKFAWSWRNSQKSVARKIGEQNVELTEDHGGVDENASLATTPTLASSLIPSEVVHGVENVDVKSERQEELPSIEVVGEPPAETVEEFDCIVEPVASSPTEESVPMPTLDARGPDTSAKGRGGRIAKSSSDKKFVWSWRNSQKAVARKIGEQNVELGGEQNEVGQTAMSMPTTPELAPSSIPTELGHGIVENVDLESERQELHGIEAAAVAIPDNTAEGLDNVLEPTPSSPTVSSSTLEKKEPEDCSKSRGSEVPKVSSEKKFGWTWKKKKQYSEPLQDAMPMMDKFRSQDDDAISLSGKGVLEVVQGIENVDVKSENRELRSTDAAASLPETKETMQPPSGPEDSAEARRGRVPNPSGEKKFEWSWTKKKRCSEPVGDTPAVVDQFPQDDNAIPLSRKEMLEESREIIMSPLTRFHSSSAIMSPVRESSEFNGPVSWDENHSSEFRFSPRPDSNSPKANSSPCKTSPWWFPKTNHPVVEKALPTEKVSTSWWSRKHRRADSRAAASSSLANISSPTGISSTNENDAIPRERSGQLSPLSTTTTVDNNNIHNSLVENSNRVQNNIILEIEEDELSVEVPRRARHRRERSDSLPTVSSKFSRLHGRQTSLSEITLPRTPELSPGSSSGRATDYNRSTGGLSSTSSSPFSMPRMEGNHHPEHVKRSSDSNSAGNRNDKVGWTSVSTTTPLPTSSYQIRPSAVRMLDLANEQLKGGSPFHRSDLDVSTRGPYRSPPSAATAEIRITDKLKAPLEEILSLLAIGDNDEQRKVDSSTGGAIAGVDGLRQASSSSSSEEETSSEEEWSARSDNEDEPQEQQPQFTLLPPSGRIRRRLPPYVFSRDEPTAN